MSLSEASCLDILLEGLSLLFVAVNNGLLLSLMDNRSLGLLVYKML
jgi:hypothetical protein